MKLFVALCFLWTLSAAAKLEKLDFAHHPCRRECNSAPMHCKFNLTLTTHFTMQPDCLNCTNGVIEDCYNVQCIPGDGSNRIVTVFNAMLPAPTIQVCENDTIEVYFTNLANPESSTIHWHGMYQRNTQNMDGVPMVTQWGILPFTNYIYKFKAYPPGTHYYHSHSGHQRADGAQGALIVKKKKCTENFDSPICDLNSKHYEHDLPEHVMFLSEWFKELAIIEDQRYIKSKTFYFETMTTLLVNGFGPMRNNSVPPKVFNVKPNTSYRFRIVSGGIVVCPIQLSIDNHKLKIIATDGRAIKPKIVDSIVILSGERIDIVVETNQNVDQYAIRLSSSILCDVNSTAVLAYETAEPKTFSLDDEFTPPEVIYNCPNTNRSEHCLNYIDLNSIETVKHSYSRKPDVKLYIPYVMTTALKEEVRGVEEEITITPYINKIAFSPPKYPLLFYRNCTETCNIDHKYNCIGEYCECPHVVEIKKNALVELIMIDLGSDTDLLHPFHLHGYSVYVVGEGKFGDAVTLDLIKALDDKNKLPRNFNNAVVKDTFAVADGGYTIVRFYADNPGYWFFHCHLNFHAEGGMTMVFKVGDPPKFGKHHTCKYGFDGTI